MIIVAFAILALIIAAPIALVLILTDLVTVPPTVRANASKVATVLFLALVTWFFVAYAMSMP